MERLLVLCRHGQSDWNLKNLFTGWKDPDLTAQGVEEAKAAGAIGLTAAFQWTPVAVMVAVAVQVWMLRK